MLLFTFLNEVSFHEKLLETTHDEIGCVTQMPMGKQTQGREAAPSIALLFSPLGALPRGVEPLRRTRRVVGLFGHDSFSFTGVATMRMI
jgi:hypothetical protein